MRNQIQKYDEINQKQKSLSTSSFYRQGGQTRQNIKNSIQLPHAVQFQQRETQQAIERDKLSIQLKMQYMSKRSADSVEDNKKMIEQLAENEKAISQAIKTLNRTDKTKQWASEMEKTIQSIMQNAKQDSRKHGHKHVNQINKQFDNCQELENKVREQKKQRQRQWEQLIDNVGETIIDAQAIVQSEKQQMELKLAQLERNIIDIEQQSAVCIQVQQTSRKKEHEYLAKLIQRIMNKLLC